nr:hypothetical protein CFP56_23211 [Quercus suber]POE62679.1 hypothetical protein CFP56_23212 [Quercus suber]
MPCFRASAHLTWPSHCPWQWAHTLVSCPNIVAFLEYQESPHSTKGYNEVVKGNIVLSEVWQGFQGGTTMPENTVKLMAQAEIFGNGGASVLNIEDSAREVPTGPDPLHHNNNPIEP